MMYVSLQIFVCVLLVSLVDCGDDLSSLIDQVFRPARDQNENNANVEQIHNPLDCTCVPYYLCANNSVITNGVGVIDIRVKDGPCSGALDVCCGKPLSDNDRITPTTNIRDGCGRRNPEGIGFRITGNENGEVQFGEFPWMVAVLKEEEADDQKLNVYQCGGALIHPEVVMTAAHCVNSRDKNYKIRAGEWDTQTSSELYPHQDAQVKNVVIHPDYYAGALYNDVALLFLDSAITLADNIDAVCLPQQDESFDFSQCYASGWGKDVFGKEGKYQVILKKVELPIVPRKTCEEALRRTRLGQFFSLHSSFVCAGGEAGKDTCKGDGGSPLVCPVANAQNKFVQVGIVAWGIGCGENGTPGVYANVASFRHWINDQLVNRNLETKYYEY